MAAPAHMLFFKVFRLYDTWFETVPGLGRLQFHNDWKYGRVWAKRSDL